MMKSPILPGNLTSSQLIYLKGKAMEAQSKANYR